MIFINMEALGGTGAGLPERNKTLAAKRQFIDCGFDFVGAD
jgi:hypothetical protein